VKKKGMSADMPFLHFYAFKYQNTNSLSKIGLFRSQSAPAENTRLKTDKPLKPLKKRFYGEIVKLRS